MTPARAAEVLRNLAPWVHGDAADGCKMGADALEFCEWLFARDEWGSLNVKICLAKWNRQGAPMDYARAEWEKERKG